MELHEYVWYDLYPLARLAKIRVNITSSEYAINLDGDLVKLKKEYVYFDKTYTKRVSKTWIYSEKPLSCLCYADGSRSYTIRGVKVYVDSVLSKITEDTVPLVIEPPVVYGFINDSDFDKLGRADISIFHPWIKPGVYYIDRKYDVYSFGGLKSSHGYTFVKEKNKLRVLGKGNEKPVLLLSEIRVDYLQLCGHVNIQPAHLEVKP
jgi:hypothetical protein